PLQQKRADLWPKLVGLSLSIFAVTFLLSLLIARRVSRALSKMAGQAGELAHLPAGRRLRQEELEHREFRRLAQAFNQVLDSLEEAREQLRQAGVLERQAQERRYQALVEASPAGILSLDTRGRIRFVNRTFGEMTGFEPGEVLGRSALSLFPPDQRARALRAWREKEREDTPRRREYGFLRKDGSSFWVDAWLVPDPDPRAGLTQVYVQDVTKRRQARQDLALEHSRLAAILDGNPIATFVIDRDHRLVHWNRACETLTGVGKQEVLGSAVPSGIFYQGARRPVMADLVLQMDQEALAAYYQGKNLARSPLIPEAFEASDLLTIRGQARHFYFLAARLR
ncbi:MAG: hypothetical protein C0405_15175, partial [Desulfovibrio sp.]|nr:hypothetical protein [Desulfovibrio sp.]